MSTSKEQMFPYYEPFYDWQVEAELIDKLDIHIINNNKGDQQYKQLFNTMWVNCMGTSWTKKALNLNNTIL